MHGMRGYCLLLAVLLLPCFAWPAATPATYRASLGVAQALVKACSTAAQGCDPAKAGSDLLVEPGGYTVRLGWLRTTVDRARTATPVERTRSMAEAQARLEADLLDLNSSPVATAQTLRGRRAVDAILSRREFSAVGSGPSFWQRQKARFWAWLDRLLFQAALASSHRPWIGLVVEWTILFAAIAGLLAFAFRALRRDSLGGPLGWQPRHTQGGQAEVDWAAMAEEAASSGKWRDAIHALYWASVASLSQTGRWRPSAPRTPREYLRLLEPASSQRNALGALTSLLERVWYARREASQLEYQQACSLAGALGVSRPGESSR